MPHAHLWCCPGLANGHVPKKQKKNKKEDALPSLDAMLADGIASSDAQQQPGTAFNVTSPGPQEAALHMLESLVQVSSVLSGLCRACILMKATCLNGTGQQAANDFKYSSLGDYKQVPCICWSP